MLGSDFLRHHWPTITISLTAAVIACLAIMMLFSMPPHRIVMATGAEGDAYYEIGQRYRMALARANVDVQLVQTAGSVENRALLRDPHSGVSVALIEGGVGMEANSTELQSLGTVFYEPLWWFYKREIDGVGAEGLRGHKVSIGPEGSGTRALALQLTQLARTEGQYSALPLAPRAAADKLAAGQIDVAFMMTSWESPAVQQLLADERIALSGFPHADALVAIYPFLSKVVVPRGVTDIAKDRPPTDVALIATKASLVVRRDLHPAIQYLLLNAAAKIHSGPSIFNHPNQFPAAEPIDIPLSDEAVRFYRSGLPFLNCGADRQARHPARSRVGGALSNDAVSASNLRLGDAVEGITNVRRITDSGRRHDKGRWHLRCDPGIDGAARPLGETSKSPQNAGRLCKHAVLAARSYWARARHFEQAGWRCW